MLLSTGDVDGTTSNLIVELNLTDRTHRTVSRFDVASRDDLAVGDVQLAAALLASATVRPDSPADRGMWPKWAIITTIACLTPLALAVTYLTLRRRHRRVA